VTDFKPGDRVRTTRAFRVDTFDSGVIEGIIPRKDGLAPLARMRWDLPQLCTLQCANNIDVENLEHARGPRARLAPDGRVHIHDGIDVTCLSPEAAEDVARLMRGRAPQLRVVGVANLWRSPNGFELHCSLPAPNRHSNLIAAMHSAGFSRAAMNQECQGFLLSDGSFADRRHAANVARLAGQLLNEPMKNRLLSEDVW
jgi:hypothetical protein